MDFEYTFWLMLQLCISPKTAYRHTSYHKQTKNHWARDDPAYVVICCLLVAAAASAYCVAFSSSVWHSLWTIMSAVFVDFLAIGVALATVGWFLANKCLRKKTLHSHAIEQHVEWMYAFDVHCNSYFPLFLLLYVLQYFLCPLLLWHSFFSAVLSNLLYMVALSYYHYLSFLGYSALPFLEHTEVFLWPVAAIILIVPFTTLTGFNPTRFTLNIYFG
ncbi:Protein unc-50 homolog [Coccomyxa sp. Obi]|nr:Protein unc-50 homolog [Coccomyxa sp. Obi]